MSRLIGLMGYAQSGKDTVGRILVEEYGFARVSFADKLRACLYALNPIVLHGSYSNDSDNYRLQALVDRIGWDDAKKLAEVRVLLQRMGTEAGRQVLGQDVWVEAAFGDARHNIFGELVEDVVLTDVRFGNEYTAVKRRGGQVWRVERPGTEPVNAHSSETALDGFPVDLYIENIGTVDDLRQTVKEVLA